MDKSFRTHSSENLKFRNTLYVAYKFVALVYLSRAHFINPYKKNVNPAGFRPYVRFTIFYSWQKTKVTKIMKEKRGHIFISTLPVYWVGPNILNLQSIA